MGLIESSIVQVMKSEKQLKMHELIREKVPALIKLFIPEEKLIKQRIESLIERGFLKRDEGD